MTRSMRCFRSIQIILVVLTVATACEPRRNSKGNDVISTPEAEQAFATHCFGRYLVRLPNTMVLYQEGGQNIQDVQLSVVPMNQVEFAAAIARRKRELEATFMSGPEKYPFLRSTTELRTPLEGVIFDRAESPNSGGRISRQLELDGWKNGFRITAKINAIDTSFPEDANEPALQSLKPTLQANLARLLDVVGRTSGRGENIPSTKGVCICNGFVSGAATDAENVAILYQMKDAPDVFFRFTTNSAYAPSDTLLERGKKVEALILENQGRVLRRGSRTIAAAGSGEEFLYSILGDAKSDRGRIMTHKFALEANRKIGGAAAPLILVDLEIGEVLPSPDGKGPATPAAVPVTRASLSDAEAISLWDAVIPTIQPRPGAF